MLGWLCLAYADDCGRGPKYGSMALSMFMVARMTLALVVDVLVIRYCCRTIPNPNS